MNVLPLVQARMDSDRLPGKVMMEIAGKPMLAHVVEAAAGVAAPLVVVPVHAVNDPIRQWCTTNSIQYSSWPVIGVRDPLAEFTYATRDQGDYLWIVRITADCPMLKPHHVSMFSALLRDPTMLYTNRPIDMDGYDLEGFTVGRLRWAYLYAAGMQREHICPLLYDSGNVVRFSIMGNSHLDVRKGKVSVDTLEEFNIVKAIMEKNK